MQFFGVYVATYVFISLKVLYFLDYINNQLQLVSYPLINLL